MEKKIGDSLDRYSGKKKRGGIGERK